MSFKDVAEIYEIDNAGRSFEKAYADYFEQPAPDKIKADYQIIIVAESLDESTERIVQHLSDVHKVNINAVFFNIFSCDGKEFVGRSWLKDPVEVEESAVAGRRSQQWTGFYFVNTGIDDSRVRNWDLNRQYGFISAGGGLRWINAIKKLTKGDKIFALIKGKGYVGYGIVEEDAVLVKDFKVNDALLVNKLPEGHPWRQLKDISKDEWLVKVSWVKVVKEDEAVWFKGAFANQNVVCKLRDQNTFKFLVDKFGIDLSE